MTHVGVGIVGAGFIADIHAHAFAQVAGHEAQVVAVAAPPTRRDGFAKRHGIGKAYDSLEAMLADDEVRVVDLCTPPSVHVEAITAALRAGKHVICEKPLTGYFDVPAGGADTVDRRTMYEGVQAEIAQLQSLATGSALMVGYAENYVYAPAVQKCREMLEKTGARVTLLLGEESHSGSHSRYARNWRDTGGGSLIRQGCHPLSAMMYLKQVEARTSGRDVRLESVLADTAMISPTLTADQRRFLDADPVDVEDMANMILAFDDGTRGVVTASDVTVGGVRNTVQVFTTESVYLCQMSQNDSLRVYHSDAAAIEDVYLTEKLGTKAGWQSVLLDEHRARGYLGEMQDFIDCVVTGNTPQSGLDLAAVSIEAIYAAYESAATDRRVHLNHVAR